VYENKLMAYFCKQNVILF